MHIDFGRSASRKHARTEKNAPHRRKASEYTIGSAKREQRARHVLAHSPQNSTGWRPIEGSDAYGYVTPYLEQVLGMGTVQASTTLMAYGVFCLISNILGGWIDARFGMKALLVTFVLQAAALLGLFVVGGAMPLALVFVFSLALLMYLFSVSCITHFMDVARSHHPKSMVLASSVEPMAFNVGISFGTAAGGAVVSGIGIAYVGAVGAAFSLVAWTLTLVTIRLARWERKRARA